MTSQGALLPNGKQQFADANGSPLAAGSVFFYIPNTLSLKPTWQDPLLTIPNSNPVLLDGSGEAVIYGAGAYRQIVISASGVTIWDELTQATPGPFPSWGGQGTGTENAQACELSSFASEDGSQISYRVTLANTSATTLAVGGLAPKQILKDNGSGPVALTGGELVVGALPLLTYDATLDVFHIPAQLYAPITDADLAPLTYLPTTGGNLTLPQTTDTVVLEAAAQPISNKAISASSGDFTGEFLLAPTQSVGNNGTAVATTAFVNAELAANVYTGTDVNNTNFPIATPLLVSTLTAINRNAQGTMGLAAGSIDYTFGGTGVTGTWACRGTVAPGGNNISLFQRVL